MKRQYPAIRSSVAIAAAAIAMSVPSLAHAQDGGPGGPPPQGGRRPGGPPPGFGGFGPHKLTIADVPVEMMKAELSLSEEQATKIGEIERATRDQRRRLMPPGRGGPGGPGGPPRDGDQGGRPPGGPPPDGGQGGPPPGGPPPDGGQGGPPPGGPPPDGGQGGFPPPPQNGSEMRSKMDALDKAAVAKIEAELSSEQRAHEAGIVANATGLQHAGIPLELYAKLSLTSDQERRLVAIGQKMEQSMKDMPRGDPQEGQDAMRRLHDDTHKAVQAVLNDEQKLAIDEFMRSRRGRGPGGG